MLMSVIGVGRPSPRKTSFAFHLHSKFTLPPFSSMEGLTRVFCIVCDHNEHNLFLFKLRCLIFIYGPFLTVRCFSLHLILIRCSKKKKSKHFFSPSFLFPLFFPSTCGVTKVIALIYSV